jgi:ribonuclease HI
MRLDVPEDEARERLERADASFEDQGDGWRARLGGGVVDSDGDGVVLLGNVDRLEKVLTDAEGEITVAFDGASRGNPGRSAAAYILYDDDGLVKRDAEVIGEATNNEAEYVALLRGVAEARDMGFDEVEAVGDSELVVRQIDGDWKCRAKNLQPLYEEIEEIIEEFDSFEIRHVPREENAGADELANAALDA